MKMNKEMKEAIRIASEDTVLNMMKNNMIRDNKRSAFQRTETLLYNYRSFKAVVNDKNEMIKEIKEYGIRNKSMSILPAMNSCHGDTFKMTDKEKAEAKIAELNESVRVTENYIRLIDNALNLIKSEQYYDIIPMKYFEGRDREYIASYYQCSLATISREKKKLIHKLQIRLFSDDVIREILFS